jgi:O-antigen ligase
VAARDPLAIHMNESTASDRPDVSRRLLSRDSPLVEHIGRFCWGLCLLLVLAVPLMISPAGDDRFRTPKDALFIAGVALFAPLFLVWCFARLEHGAITWRRSPTIKLVLAVIFWAMISTLLSTDPWLSTKSFVWVVISALFFVGVWKLGATRGVSMFWFAIAPAVINSVVVLLQALRVWSPVDFPAETPFKATLSALIGNPNEVGSYLTVPFVLALALASVRRRERLLFALAAAIILTGVLVSQSVTAIVASVAGALILLMRIVRWRMFVVTAVITVCTGALIIPNTTVGERISRSAGLVGAPDAYDDMLSGRLGAYLAAFMMAADHPISGVGPGRFAYHYFEYRLRAGERWGPYLSPIPTNFGEVHNDHLEISAESGLIGYSLFIFALVMVGRAAMPLRMPGSRDERSEAVEAIGLPVAVTFGLLTLAQFPLQLTAPSVVILFVAGMLRSWVEHPG